MKVLSLFDGMSCGRIALRELGIEPEKYYASEIDKYAIAQTKLNFPDTIHLGDVTKWRDWDIDWGHIDLVLAGSPCFAAGTKIITSEGIKCIEDIKEGDMVLTHKNRFRKVLRVGAKIAPTVILSAQGIIDTEVTANHPYYVREFIHGWDSLDKTYMTFSKPIWKQVMDLNDNDYIGIPKSAYKPNGKKQCDAVIIDDIVWVRFRKIRPAGKTTTVYNMEVEEDNSYTANNAIVHNCQGFSFAGQMLAFDDPRSALFFVFADILNHVKSLNPNVLFLLENVNMEKRHMKVITDYVGVFPVNINSMLVSAQSRNRWYWTNIRTKRVGLFGELHSDIPQPADRGILLKDILEENVDKKYFLSEKMLRFLESHAEKMNTKMKVLGENDKTRCITATAEYKGNLEPNYICVGIRPRYACLTTKRNEYGKLIRKDYEAGKIHEKRKNIRKIEPRYDGKTNCLTTTVKDNYIIHFGDDLSERERKNLRDTDGKSHSLTASCYKGAESNGTTLINDGTSIRRLTPTECARLQTIPEWYKWGCSETQQYRMLGNGWTVEVIKHILSFGKWN